MTPLSGGLKCRERLRAVNRSGPSGEVMVNSPQTWLFERGLQRAGRRPLDCEPKGRRVADRGTDGFLDSKNRRDHIVPQVYLRGFIHPQRDQKQGPLEVFHLASNTWGLPQTPDDLCIEVGFYDYSVDRAETTADDAFRELEAGFFAVRGRLRRDRFTAVSYTHLTLPTNREV